MLLKKKTTKQTNITHSPTPRASLRDFYCDSTEVLSSLSDPVRQRPAGLTEENGTTFSDQTGQPTGMTFTIFLFIPLPNPRRSEIFRREKGQLSGLSQWNGNFCSDQSDRQAKLDHFQRWSRTFHLTSDRNFQAEFFSKTESAHGFMVSSIISNPLWRQRKYCSLSVLGDSAHRPAVHGEMFPPLRKFQSRDFTGPSLHHDGE